MAKLNKEQLKKLYDYGGTLSPKDWADMIDSLMPDTPDIQPGTIIETTYDEAKDLYESGQMIPGVYYKFRYIHNLYQTTHNSDLPADLNVKEMFNEFDILVYINNNGDLKAKGSYALDLSPDYELGNVYVFESDYTFKPKYINFTIPLPDDHEYDIIEIGYFKTNYITLDYFDSELLNLILDLFPNAYYIYDPEYTHIGIPNSIVYIGYNSYENINETITLISQNGIIINIDIIHTSYSISTENLIHTGCVYNLDYGEFKHSFLYNIYTYSTEADPRCIDCRCNIFSTEFEPIYNSNGLYISSGDIIDSELFFDAPFVHINTIYANKLNINIYISINDDLILYDKPPYSFISIDEE